MTSLLLAIVSAVLGAQGTASPPGADSIELVESAPVETALDHPDLPNADAVWVEMVDGARAELDLAHFYASDRLPSRLTKVVEAIERAAARGVRVRFLASEAFYATYPETLDRLARQVGVEVRRYDLARATGGGVLHAKYFVVDGREVFLGSQNFDWRSLEHVQELGVRVRSRDFARALSAEFEVDWRVAGGAAPAEARAAAPGARAGGAVWPREALFGDRSVRIEPAFSPRDLVLDRARWDLPKIVRAIEGAQRSVRVQLLTYRPTTREGHWDELESALRRAAARGVRVHLLVADWSRRAGTIEALQSLEPLPNVEVRMATIPRWSGGFVPFARVVHAKDLVVDERIAWIGTGNWERDSFYESRNVGLLVDGEPVAGRLARFFDETWDSELAKPVDPCAAYPAPSIGEEK